jgi:uncharacterized HAD superfamily protein/glycosyltransferase involved in cell wall biosynthesis
MINFKSYHELSRDIAAGLGKLPKPDIVVGIPKSGLIPATMIASFFNCSLYDLDSFHFVFSRRSGFRKSVSGGPSAKPTVLLVDDSVNTGAEFTRVKARLQALADDYDFRCVAVYGLGVQSDAAHADVVLASLPQPRVFQWNYRNHIIAEHSCFDMDGVLCIDPPEEDNDDGQRYIDYILNAPVLCIPKKRISCIVTSRLEKYRPQTEEWLRNNNVLYRELIMLDLPTAEERRRLRAHAPFKANVFAARNEILFIESNWKQAQQIAKIADKPVICTENDVFLYGADHLKSLKNSGQLFDLETLSRETELQRQVSLLNALLVSDDVAARDEAKKLAVARKRGITHWETERVTAKAINAKAAKVGGKIQKVLMISVSFDKTVGAGAAASSARLRDALRSSGLDVHTLSIEDFARARPPGTDQPISGAKLGFWNSYHDPSHSQALRARVKEIDPDVIVLGAVDRGIISLFDLAEIRYPIVWITRDNWAHTGGCLFQLDKGVVFSKPASHKETVELLQCGRWSDGCGDCPAITDKRERAKASAQFTLKKIVYEYRKDIVFAPISEWLARMLKEAPLTRNNTVSKVYNPIEILPPPASDDGRAATRAKYKIPADAKVILFSAHSLSNPRKGMGLLSEYLKQANPTEWSGVVWLQMGKEDPELVPLDTRIKVIQTGFVTDEDEKRALYLASDVVAVPTLQETLSVVASDAVCNGIPVVAFRTSGLTDFIRHRHNGYLAKPFDVRSFVDGLKWALFSATRERLRENAYAVAYEVFESKKNVQELYKLMEVAREKFRSLEEVPQSIAQMSDVIGLVSDELAFRHIHIRYLNKRIEAAEGKIAASKRPQDRAALSNQSNEERSTAALLTSLLLDRLPSARAKAEIAAKAVPDSLALILTGNEFFTRMQRVRSEDKVLTDWLNRRITAKELEEITLICPETRQHTISTVSEFVQFCLSDKWPDMVRAVGELTDGRKTRVRDLRAVFDRR